MPTAEMM